MFVLDLLLYHQYLPKSLVFTKLALAELCLAECLFKVVPHCQVMNLLPLVVYSLYESELTSQVINFFIFVQFKILKMLTYNVVNHFTKFLFDVTFYKFKLSFVKKKIRKMVYIHLVYTLSVTCYNINFSPFFRDLVF